MDKKILTTITSIILIGSFFMPYLKSGAISATGFEIVTAPYNAENKGMGILIIKYIWLLLPLSGIVLLIGALNNGKYFIGRWAWALLPLAVLLLVIARIYMDAKRIGSPLSVSQLAAELGVGFWVAMAASLLLALYWPRQKA